MAWFASHKLKLATAGLMLAVVLFFFGGPILFAIRVWMVTPSGDFAEHEAPAAPDYRQDEWWAALPSRNDPADVSPRGMDLDRQSEAKADVFYVHPTTFISADGWNQPKGHEAAETMLNEWVLTTQASAFNGCCRVYAPHYRQATIAAFFDLEGRLVTVSVRSLTDASLNVDAGLALLDRTVRAIKAANPSSKFPTKVGYSLEANTKLI